MPRGAVSLVAVTKSFGPVAALREVSLEIAAGELVTLLGPSGCGKTTLLRLLAGLDAPDAGHIVVSGRDVTRLPAHRRPVNTVFQHYALFPHRTVAGNVAFGLEMARCDRASITARVERALDLVRLRGLGARRIDQLSGGQRQRVALARAVVLEPEVLLLDEPMSALDRKLREEMRAEVRALHRRLETTFVFVTHDQDEALALSDRVAVMSEGRIEQTGTPQEVYERPRTRFVADFLGVANVMRVIVEDLDGDVARLRTPAGLAFLGRSRAFRAGDSMWIGIRPERMRLEDPAPTVAMAARCVVQGALEEPLYRGGRTDWRVRIGEERLLVAETGSDVVRRPGAPVAVSIPADAVLVLDEGAAESPAESETS